MKQLLQSLKNGEITLLEVPLSSPKKGYVLIKTLYSLVSSGTEKTLIDFGKANLINKARQQPDKVKDVINKLRTDGFNTTFDAVISKLDTPLPLGYCNVGVIEKLGVGVKGYKVGDVVVSNGNHAEFVNVPKQLIALLPKNILPEYGTFVPMASIGLQGVRLSKPELGETFLVSGLGLVGQLTCQILLNNGCNVLGIDPDQERCDLAKSYGVEILNLSDGSDPIEWCMQKTNNIGIDGAIITAATTSSDPIHLAAEACRTRGRIVMVGVTGLNLRRDLFYKKEISFQVSCSYGPGRYDDFYEKKGNDYPIGFVRWTEQRNFESVVKLISQNKISLKNLITHKIPFEKAKEAYNLLESKKNKLGIILTYKNANQIKDFCININEKEINVPRSTGIGLVGAGAYASRILLSAFAKAGAEFKTIVSNNGLAPSYIGRKYRFKKASTNFNSILNDDHINSVIITTRHDSHADLVKQCLKAGKNIYVEKPLCLNKRDLDEIRQLYLASNQILMIGFNRRFSPLILELKKRLKIFNSPKAFIYTCNAGKLPNQHWIKEPDTGGGRLIGEACHFLDLLIFLSESFIVDSSYFYTVDKFSSKDTFSINLKFSNGSIGTIHYFENGSKEFPKERIEVFCEGNIFRLDNFIKLQSWGRKKFRNIRNFSQNKGQFNCAKEFLKSVKYGKSSPIPFQEIYNSHEEIFKLQK